MNNTLFGLNKNYALDITKMLLILGVVLIHCNSFEYLPDEDPSFSLNGVLTVKFISEGLCSVCVSSFFIISGLLYFKNIKKFTFNIYWKKTKVRFHSLLIPYILWNVISLVIQLFKYKFLGYPCYGVITDGHLDFVRLIEGFWDYYQFYPYAFAFWFIRNLIVFVTLSPLVYVLGNKFCYPCILIACLLLNNSFHGAIYFITGCFISRYFKWDTLEVSSLTGIICLILWIGLAVVSGFTQDLPFQYPINYLMTLSALTALYYFSQKCAGNAGKLTRMLVSSTFFIYAVHQLFCTLTRTYYDRLFGIDTFLGVISAYISTFLTLVTISVIVWLFLQRISPATVRILSGGR